MIKPTIFRDYDIRGIVGKDFETTDAKKVGQAFGTYIQEISGPNLLVGRDNRFTSDELSAYFIQGLLQTGCNIIDTGLTLRPLVQMGILKENFNGGALITGSHNPPEYNGIKFFTRRGLPVFGVQIKKIKDLFYSGKFLQGTGKIGYTEEIDNLYFDAIVPKLAIEFPTKIVVDAGNGTTSKFAPELFRRLGSTVISLYCNLNGSYPYHTPNPEARVNTLDLSQKVIEEKADLGIAFDTDGDRFGIVDEKGNFYENDLTLLVLAKKALEEHRGAKIIYDVKSSYVLEGEIKKAGGIPIMIPTGHPYFQERMKNDPEVILGGELSGHTMFRENHCFDDALFAAAKILETVSQSKKTASNLYQGIPQTAHTPEIKAPCPDEDKFDIVKEIKEVYKKEYPVLELNGARVLFSDTAWALVRASNTTPCLSLRFEAESKKHLKKIMEDAKSKLEKYPQVDLSQLDLFLEAGK